MVFNDDDARSQGLVGAKIDSGSLPVWKWTGAEVPELLYDVNASALVALQRIAQGGKKIPAGGTFDCISSHWELWSELDEPAVRRAARVPCLLVDVHWQSEAWWHWAKGHRARSAKGAPTNAVFSPKAARELMVETLLLAWHTARSDRPTATLLLGIAPAVAERIAGLSSRDVRRIAAEHCRELRPQFEGNLKFWRSILLAARSGNSQSLSLIYQEAIQLLATEVLPGVR